MTEPCLSHLVSAAAPVLTLAGPASAQLAPEPPVGSASTAGGRYEDLPKASRCMDFTYAFGRGWIANDLGRYRDPNIQRIAESFRVPNGRMKRFSDPAFLRLPTREAWSRDMPNARKSRPTG